MIIFSKDFLKSLKIFDCRKYILKKMNLQELSREETKRIKELGLAKDKFEYMEKLATKQAQKVKCILGITTKLKELQQKMEA